MLDRQDRGMSWGDEIPQGWKSVPLKTRFTFGKGLSITKEDLVDAGHPVISYGQIHSKKNTGVSIDHCLFRFVKDSDTNQSAVVYPNDFIFADTSEDLDGCGNCVYNDTLDSFFGGYHTIILHSISNTTNKYLAYLFKTDLWRSQIRSCLTEVKVYSISQKVLKKTAILIPPFEVQKRIVDLLDIKCAEIDSILKNTLISIEEFKALKSSVITEAITKGVRGNRPMKASNIQWAELLPAEWEPVNPKVLFTQRKEKAHQGERQLASSQQYGIIYQDDYMALTGTKIVTVEKDFDILKHVEAGDFVISMRSFQGGLEYSENTGSISSAYVMLKPNPSKVFNRFYKWLFKSQIYIDALCSTSNMVRDGQAMRYSNFTQIRLYLVPIDEQQEIAAYLDEKCAAIDSLIASKDALIAELEAYKKSLIYEYVTGKKKVI